MSIHEQPAWSIFPTKRWAEGHNKVTLEHQKMFWIGRHWGVRKCYSSANMIEVLHHYSTIAFFLGSHPNSLRRCFHLVYVMTLVKQPAMYRAFLSCCRKLPATTKVTLHEQKDGFCTLECLRVEGHNSVFLLRRDLLQLEDYMIQNDRCILLKFK